jgi:hypothetical protein
MEKLYIKLSENNTPVGHPHFESNLQQIFPEHDFSSGPPSGWMEFERVAPPALGPYEKFDDSKGGDIALAFPHNGLEYKIVNGKYTDVWHVLDLTDGEKLTKQNTVKSDWSSFIATSDGADYSHYVFDEAYCAFVEPEE